MTAGVLTGMGEATMWPVMALFVVHYARCYARHAPESVDKYLPQFLGVFYAVFQLSSVSALKILEMFIRLQFAQKFVKNQFESRNENNLQLNLEFSGGKRLISGKRS